MISRMIGLSAACAICVAIGGPAMPGARSRQQLIDTLAVLRRPPSGGDRDPSLIRRLRSLVPSLEDPGPERLDASLVRLAGETPWGSSIVLAGFVTVGRGGPGGIPEMVGALVSGEIGPRAPAAAIRQRGDVAYFQVEPRGVRVVIVVPDGVARLAYSAPGIPTVRARVQNNVAAFVIRPRPRAPGLVEAEASMVWFGPGGAIIRRVPGRFRSAFDDRSG
jgi:hypothetical protein